MSRPSKRARQRARRALDYHGMTALHGQVLHVRAYRNAEDAARSIEATPKDGADGLVTVYDITCSAKLPTSPVATASGITVRFDTSDGEDPRVPPTAFVISPERPFSTHVHRDSGTCCLGSHWLEMGGKESLGELTLRLFGAFNFEDPLAAEPGYHPEAETYRIEVLGGRPFDPSIRWPVIPTDIYCAEQRTDARPRVAIVGGRAPETANTGARIVTAASRRVVVLPRRAS